MKTNREVREEIIYQLVKAYKEVRRVERQLNKPAMKHVYRTKCKAAKKQKEMKLALEEGLVTAQCDLVDEYRRLPEVRAEGHHDQLVDLQNARDFAAACARQPRRRKYLVGQKLLMTA